MTHTMAINTEDAKLFHNKITIAKTTTTNLFDWENLSNYLSQLKLDSTFWFELYLKEITS